MNKKDALAVLGVLVLLIVVFVFITGQSGMNVSDEEFMRGVEEEFGNGTWYNISEGRKIFVPENATGFAEKINKTEAEVCEMMEGMWVNGTCVCPEGYSNHPVFKYECIPPPLTYEVTPW